jgi:hypothetical protein
LAQSAGTSRARRVDHRQCDIQESAWFGSPTMEFFAVYIF